MYFICLLLATKEGKKKKKKEETKLCTETLNSHTYTRVSLLKSQPRPVEQRQAQIVLKMCLSRSYQLVYPVLSLLVSEDRSSSECFPPHTLLSCPEVTQTEQGCSVLAPAWSGFFHLLLCLCPVSSHGLSCTGTKKETSWKKQSLIRLPVIQLCSASEKPCAREHAFFAGGCPCSPPLPHFHTVSPQPCLAIPLPLPTAPGLLRLKHTPQLSHQEIALFLNLYPPPSFCHTHSPRSSHLSSWLQQNPTGTAEGRALLQAPPFPRGAWCSALRWAGAGRTTGLSPDSPRGTWGTNVKQTNRQA